jgi:hypothetical protein
MTYFIIVGTKFLISWVWVPICNPILKSCTFNLCKVNKMSKSDCWPNTVSTHFENLSFFCFINFSRHCPGSPSFAFFHPSMTQVFYSYFRVFIIVIFFDDGVALGKEETLKVRVAMRYLKSKRITFLILQYGSRQH